MTKVAKELKEGLAYYPPAQVILFIQMAYEQGQITKAQKDRLIREASKSIREGEVK